MHVNDSNSKFGHKALAEKNSMLMSKNEKFGNLALAEKDTGFCTNILTQA